LRRAVLLALAGAALLGGLVYLFLGGGPVVVCRRDEGSVLRTVHVFESEGVNPGGKAGRVRQEVAITTTALAVVPRDRMTLKATVDRIVIEVFGDGPAPRLRMDTAGPAAPPPSGPPGRDAPEEEKFAWTTAPLRALAGESVEVEQKLSGRVIEIQGFPEFRKKAAAAFPEGDGRRAMIEGYPWEGWLAGILSPAVVVPERGMVAGEPPQRFLDLRPLPELAGTPGFIYYAGTYEVTSVADGVATVSMKAEALLDPPSPQMPPWPANGKRDLLRLVKGTATGWVRIRLADGALLEDEHVTDLDLRYVKPEGTEVPTPLRTLRRTRTEN
jgi:hypothetical protein